MLPSPSDFSSLMTALHVGPNSTIVCYDASSAFCASARVWWTFLVMGHPPHLLHLLDGGYRQWTETFPQHIQRSPSPSIPRTVPPPSPLHPPTEPYVAHLLPALISSKASILAGLSSPSPPLLIDARDRQRFLGVDPEPRPVRYAGHIPGAVNVWHVDLQTVLKEGGRQGFIGREGLGQRLKEVGVSVSGDGDGRGGIVCYCGSGITAATVFFVLWELGKRDVSLYDASMAEWLSSSDVPIDK